jgi:hypothetical protein
MYGPYEMADSVFSDMLSITGNTMTFDFLNMYSINWNAGQATYMDNPTLLSANPISGNYYIEYTMQLKDDTLLDKHEISNHIVIGGYTNLAKTAIGTKIVDKTMNTTSNVTSVSIIINPDAINLAGSAGQYTITDVLSTTLALYTSTLKIETWENDSWTPHPLTRSDSEEVWTYTSAGANEFHFTVPDNTKLRLTYSALVKGSVGDTVEIGNTVTVAGKYTDTAQYVFFINDTKASGSGSRTTLTITKYDIAEPQISLNGAVFALYIGIAYAGWETVYVPEGLDRIITVKETNFYFLSSGTTSGNGHLIFDSQWLTPSHSAIYALKEITPPPNYSPSAEPIILFSYTPIEDIQQIADTLSVPNTKSTVNPTRIILSARKIAIGADLPSGMFRFSLRDELGNTIEIVTNP